MISLKHNKILTVFELQIYELLKIVLVSIKGLHSESSFGELNKKNNFNFKFENSGVTTMRSTKLILKFN